MRIIHLDKQILLVDETADKTKDTWYYNTKTNQLNRLKYLDENDVVVIAASPKLEDLPEFETLPPNYSPKWKTCKNCDCGEFATSRCDCDCHNELPPNTKDDVEKLATKFAYGKTENLYRTDFGEGIIVGYKQAKSEMMFSLEDMRKALLEVALWGSVRPDRFEKVEELIQSLTKPKEYEFVVEMERETLYTSDGLDYKGNLQPKIVNNKIQGVWKLKN